MKTPEEYLQQAVQLAHIKRGERNQTHMDLWTLQDPTSLLKACSYKADRAALTPNMLKKMDDAVDSINYALFGVARLLALSDSILEASSEEMTAVFHPELWDTDTQHKHGLDEQHKSDLD